MTDFETRQALRTKSYARALKRNIGYELSLARKCVVDGCPKKPAGKYLSRGYCAKHLRIVSGETAYDEDGPSSRGSYVYVMYAPELGRFKIGKSVDPKQRFFQLTAQSPTAMQLVGYARDTTGGNLEAWIHAYLAAHRERGEWFRDNSDVREIVDMIVGDRISELIERLPRPVKAKFA